MTVFLAERRTTGSSLKRRPSLGTQEPNILSLSTCPPFSLKNIHSLFNLNWFIYIYINKGNIDFQRVNKVYISKEVNEEKYSFVSHIFFTRNLSQR
jgi:hypothetical protein